MKSGSIARCPVPLNAAVVSQGQRSGIHYSAAVSHDISIHNVDCVKRDVSLRANRQNTVQGGRITTACNRMDCPSLPRRMMSASMVGSPLSPSYA
jgi:hypothetical protein